MSTPHDPRTCPHPFCREYGVARPADCPPRPTAAEVAELRWDGQAVELANVCQIPHIGGLYDMISVCGGPFGKAKRQRNVGKRSQRVWGEQTGPRWLLRVVAAAAPPAEPTEAEALVYAESRLLTDCVGPEPAQEPRYGIDHLTVAAALAQPHWALEWDWGGPWHTMLNPLNQTTGELQYYLEQGRIRLRRCGEDQITWEECLDAFRGEWLPKSTEAGMRKRWEAGEVRRVLEGRAPVDAGRVVPCPFCGEPGETMATDDRAYCANVGCGFSAILPLATWNTRTPGTGAGDTKGDEK